MFNALILAGGLGTRLGSLSKKIPKSLIKFHDRPFIFYQLDFLALNNIKKVILCLGHFSDAIEKEIDSYSSKNDLEIIYMHDGASPIGTGGAIKKACYLLNPEPFFVIYGDSYFPSLDLSELALSFRKDSGPLMTILKNNNLYDTSNVSKNGDKYLYKKSEHHPVIPRYIDAGISIFTSNMFNSYPKSFDLSLLQQKFSAQGNMQFFLMQDRFFEIGSSKGINEFLEYLESI